MPRRTRPTKPASNPVHVKRQQETLKPQVKQQVDHLVIAQDYINQQRYDNAIKELKTGLLKQTDNSALMLKLLNVYAVTNNIDQFNKLYDQVLLKADAVTLQQAQNLKVMLDEEASLQANLKESESIPHFANEPAKPESSLDFTADSELNSELNSFEVSAAIEDHPEAEESSLSFEDLESQFLTDDHITNPSVSAVKDSNTLLSSSSIQKLDNSNADNLVTPDAKSDTNLSRDFELEIEDLSKLYLSKPETSRSDKLVNDKLVADKLTSEMSILDTLEPHSSNADEFAFSLENDASDTELSTPIDTAQANHNAVNLIKDAHSLSLGNDNKDDSLNFDEETHNPSYRLNNDRFNSNGLDSETNVTNFESSKSAPRSQLNDNHRLDFQYEGQEADPLLKLAEMPDKDMGLEVYGQESSQPTDLTLENNDSAVADKASVVKEIDDADFLKVFDFVQDLDNSQITLDLAQQYLELGEYDSAKRLINEILQSDASITQKTLAEDILTRMN